MNVLEALIKLLFEAASVVLLMWGVLGYNIEKRDKFNIRLPFAIILTVGMAVLIVKTIWGLSDLIHWAAIMLIPIFVFGIRRIGIIILTVIAIERGTPIATGIVMILTHGKVDIFDVIITGSVIGYLGTFLVICAIYRFTPVKREAINRALSTKGQLFYLVLAAFMAVLIRGFGGYEKDDALSYVIEGSKMIFNAGVCILIFVMIILFITVRYQAKELAKLNAFNKKCIAEQAQQYVNLNDAQQELRKFRHDHLAHINAIGHMAQLGEAEKICEYVASLSMAQEKIKYLATGSIIGDAVINQYDRRCKEIGVKLNFMGRLNAYLSVDETDLCIMLTNVISNAYEETAKCKTDKILDIEIAEYKDTQFIRVINSLDSPVDINNGKLCVNCTSKREKESHGFGITNILEAAERSGGTVRWEKIDYRNRECVLTEITLKIAE